MKTNETQNEVATVKAFNTITGLFWRVGLGFSEECQHRATTIEPQQLAVLRATFDNVGVIAPHGAEWPNCECDDCGGYTRSRRW